ncbi:MAG TPA: DUF1566 domain-containing protein [Pseudomonadales bacterium]
MQYNKMIAMPVLAVLLAACLPEQQLDTLKPALAMVQPVPQAGHDNTPELVFSSSENGTLVYGGACHGNLSSAAKGNNTVTFDALAVGSYNDCTIRVRDAAGNLSAVLPVGEFYIVRARPVNDSGLAVCGDYAHDSGGLHNNNLNCSAVGAATTVAGTDGDGDPVPAGQDALYGRDAAAASGGLIKAGSGEAGFDFSKLDDNGAVLDASAGSWRCLRDNHTGLVWEHKTNDGGLHDRDWTYSWYNTDASANGGNAGVEDGGSCLTPGRCDTQKFVDDVNAASLCGSSNWRVPSVDELMGIMHFGRINPAIDTGLFANISASWIAWSATSWANDNSAAAYAEFSIGGAGQSSKTGTWPVMLVSSDE